MDTKNNTVAIYFNWCLILVMFITSSCVSADLASDGAALLRFLEGLDVIPVQLMSNWSNSSNPCSWKGIECSHTGDGVEILMLPGASLTGIIRPGTLGTLYRLQVLSLRSNHLSGSIPSDIFTNCTELRKIYLRSNQLNGSIPASFNTPNLNIIDLSSNHLTGPIPASISSLRLKSLFLQNNSLSGTIPEGLTSQELDLSYNNLSGSIPHSLRGFNSTSFVVNPELCGAPLTKLCISALAPSPAQPPSIGGESESKAEPKTQQGLSKLYIKLGVAGAVFFVLMMIVLRPCIVIWRLVKKKHKKKTKNNKAIETGLW